MEAKETKGAVLPALDFKLLFPGLMENVPRYLEVCHPPDGKKSTFNQRTDMFLEPLHHEITYTVPQWVWLRKQNRQATCRHIVRMLHCLTTCDKYKQLEAPDQNMLLWYVLLHDISKRGSKAQEKEDPRDPFHPFASSAVTLQLLTKWHATDKHDAGLHARILELSQKIQKASVWNKEWGIEFPDNSHLEAILKTLEDTLDRSSMWYTLVKLILLHQSVTVKFSAPSFAPLSEPEMQKYFDRSYMKFKTICDTCDELSYRYLEKHLWSYYTQLYASVYDDIVQRLLLSS